MLNFCGKVLVVIHQYPQTILTLTKISKFLNIRDHVWIRHVLGRPTVNRQIGSYFADYIVLSMHRQHEDKKAPDKI